MKIEKLNENQIRCTLTREDLAKRNLQISELAYGSEKTQNLFREMVRQADYEYGFDTDNIPLVVEAIPMNSDCIVLIITKIDDPEELDTRFSRFTQSSVSPEPNEYAEEEDEFPSASHEPAKPAAPSFDEMLKAALTDEVPKHSFVFNFKSVSDVMDFAAQAVGYPGESSLYKSEDNTYLLVIAAGKATKDEFRNICLIASEYGSGRSIPAINRSYMNDHCDVMIADDAITKLNGK